MLRLVIFGPQGAGKGTQGSLISEEWGIPAISTGDIFRWKIAQGTELGRDVKEYVDNGDLVPDRLTIRLIRDRLAQEDTSSGWLLDGFPRNIGQAEALERLTTELGAVLDAALLLEIPEDVSLHRILGRMVCSGCGRNYHVDAPPKEDSVCDVCGEAVVERSDDHDKEAIRKRLRTYYEETAPLADFYDSRGLLRRIDGYGSPEDIFERIKRDLQSVSHR
ncbi:MAG: adenylate kinase [Actinomycetota bacterium]|nr:adenylate kinase [Actinomycetota bacterium]